MNSDDQARLSLAVDVVVSVGAMLKERRANSVIDVKFKGPQDYVTELDGEAECVIKQRILAAFPDDTVFGEEMGGATSDATWVVDPIDGTSNFARGIPHYAISIGFVRGGVPSCGVIYDPELDLLYSARRGGGAFCNGQRMATARNRDLKSAMIEIGCWRRRPPPTNFSDMIGRMVCAGLDFRWRGSAALALADVARGTSDAFYGLHLNSWDAAAGIVLVLEAGGRTSDFFANDGLRKGNALLASSSGLFSELSAITT
ncbi:MAG TPA: inositol monophosphatase family protein [Hyphomicrobiaceae bacterium]|nr:inositol monophosphatase family protein [Hyphomicrobiaceae bacterium]